MISSYRQILYHIVFRTKESRKVINQEHARELYAYIMGYINNKHCCPVKVIRFLAKLGMTSQLGV